MNEGRTRHPRFNGWECLVTGCGRVDYKHGLCRKHWGEVPMRERMQIMVDSVRAAHDAAAAHEPYLQKWAENYSTGVLVRMHRP